MIVSQAGTYSEFAALLAASHSNAADALKSGALKVRVAPAPKHEVERGLDATRLPCGPVSAYRPRVELVTKSDRIAEREAAEQLASRHPVAVRREVAEALRGLARAGRS